MRLLIIGAGTSREFGFRRLRETGHRIGVVDDLSFIPIDAVDWYIPFAPKDGGEVADLVHAYNEPVDAVLCFGEWHLSAAVEAAVRLDIPGPQLNVECARQKDMMREAFAATGMRTPVSVRVEGEELPPATELPSFPLVVKPVDYSSSSGVSLVRGTVDLFGAIRLARSKSFRRTALIEQYIDGPEFSVEGVVADGRAHVFGVTAKESTNPPYFVEVGHVFPAPIPTPLWELLVAETEKAIAAVGLFACAFHCEIRVDADGPVCIEIAGRSGGDHIPRLIWEATGRDLYTAELAAVLGDDVNTFCVASRQQTAAVRFLEAPAGTMVRWPSARVAQGRALGECLIDLKHLYPSYTSVPKLDGAGRRLGYCVLRGSAAAVYAAAAESYLLAPGAAS